MPQSYSEAGLKKFEVMWKALLELPKPVESPELVRVKVLYRFQVYHAWDEAMNRFTAAVLIGIQVFIMGVTC